MANHPGQLHNSTDRIGGLAVRLMTAEQMPAAPHTAKLGPVVLHPVWRQATGFLRAPPQADPRLQRARLKVARRPAAQSLRAGLQAPRLRKHCPRWLPSLANPDGPWCGAAGNTSQGYQDPSPSRANRLDRLAARRGAPGSGASVYRADAGTALSAPMVWAQARIWPYIRRWSSLSRSSSCGCCASPACSR